MNPTHKQYSVIVRNFTFGAEESLVSTVGLLAGIAVAGVDPKIIVVTGIVVVFVGGFSMAVGSLLSEQSVEEFEAKKEVSMSRPVLAAIVMLFSFIIAGLIPLIPYALIMPYAVVWSIGLTLVTLFFLGVLNAHLFKVRAWKDGLTTLLMGALAIGVGIAVGQLAGVIS